MLFTLDLGLSQPSMSIAAEGVVWVAKEVRAAGELFQKDAAAAIEARFGRRHVYPTRRATRPSSRRC